MYHQKKGELILRYMACILAALILIRYMPMKAEEIRMAILSESVVLSFCHMVI